MRVIITILRMAIGWHFLYEGLTKLFAENWSAESFLSNTFGFTSGIYHWMAASPVRMQVIDLLNIYGLIFIGLALFIGVFIRWASLGGIALLVLYYFAYPPFGISLLGAHDGSVFIVNKIFVEAVMLIFIFFYKEKGYGIDELIRYYKESKNKKVAAEADKQAVNNRREAIKNLVSLPVLGALGGGAWWNNQKYEVDASTGATIQVNRVELSKLKGELPKGKLGDFELSRLIMGGNLIGGWAHARDLIYAESLFKAYNNEKKIIETLMLCEQAGVNCINIGYPTMSMMVKYRQLTGSKMKVIVQVGIDEKNKDIYDNVTQAIDNGMDIIQLQGNWCDWLVRDKKLDLIAGMMNRIRGEGYIAGLAAHTVDSFIACEEQGIIPDYYMKTMHHDNYWSAHPRENRQPFEVDGKRHLDHNMFHDNCFCLFPDRTVEFVNRTKVPVMGFKVLAAGAISPQDGFNWAFENGADFICVGMFDFQVVDDVNICIDTLQNLKNRKREWYA
ncbi:putative membrane protein YphA (DoxX/SURF4 family) [Parabacteroides sp. PF5-5]|uniref:DoxX family protein n=1 Tax=unclassified Parabacteroides TaxID=2649774 RepID=UPI002475C747|nr:MULTISPECIES: DoxX family protein [unclassified Parabacteroides]MDH6304393.1 putative membrane protein YphA (DoxX/SURF4 family) [Parabacteroides sp. PH5-39]MDH6315454.1 putative membrane protein YphA (DoxX/SURF4 family) [Parabacteroides sp. PF5-13]MDH6319052.1 putative membrane protein YphA (DoxX/SURF4 family) [Parabacteroides sp. PH5-13]MDH6322782.1 putative membrane protein YphA (DoxX/SURF4 family) [Parabacteroides sp. PH5-8]MDH6326646.1 putative membrane protein YphA (DoxX/SURF4 family) 